MDEYKENSYRGKAFSSDSTKLDTHPNTHSMPVLGAIMTLICLSPVLFCMCTETYGTEGQESCRTGTSLNITKGISATCITGLDIFTFDDDRLMRLDSYTRTDGSGFEKSSVQSRSGDKIVFVCANIGKDRNWWGGINSFVSLDEQYVSLENEDPDAPVMTGTCRTRAGTGCTVSLSPLVSEICLRSVYCDFRGKAYEGELMKNVSVYLVNVNSRCSITAEGKIVPSQIINNGKFNEDDVAGFDCPEIIFRKISQSIGSRKVNTDIRLLCYPNGAETEGPGSPFTRLVIEGEIQGERYWWPVDINRDNDTADKGIYRNCRYIFDIVIRRKGMTSPDMPAGSEDMDISIETRSWNEKDSYTVGF